MIVTVQVDSTAIFGIIGIFLAIEIIFVAFPRIVGFFITRICRTHTNRTFLTATEDLEHIAGIQIDGGRAPYLRVLTFTATKHIEGSTEHVHTLLTEDDARAAFCDGVGILSQDIFTIERALVSNLVEEYVRIHQRMVDIDDDVAIDMATIVAAAIHVTTLKAAIQVGWISVTRIAVPGNITTFLIPYKGIPLQQLCLVVLVFPSHRLDAQVGEVQRQLVFRRIVRIGNQSAIVSHIEWIRLCFLFLIFHRYKGIVTATHQFVEDDKRTGELKGVHARHIHTAHVTAAEE